MPIVVPLAAIRGSHELFPASCEADAKESEDSISSGLMEAVSCVSSDDAIPSACNSDVAGCLLRAQEEKFREAVQITSIRRAIHEHNVVIFPLLRRASKQLVSSTSPFSMLPKDVVRKIAWMCVDNRSEALHAMFMKLGPVARTNDLFARIHR